ncbi:MAG: choice-of-anchor U domain-containing protein, partial [Planctomycetota bacterium]
MAEAINIKPDLPQTAEGVATRMRELRGSSTESGDRARRKSSFADGRDPFTLGLRAPLQNSLFERSLSSQSALEYARFINQLNESQRIMSRPSHNASEPFGTPLAGPSLGNPLGNEFGSRNDEDPGSGGGVVAGSNAASDSGGGGGGGGGGASFGSNEPVSRDDTSPRDSSGKPDASGGSGGGGGGVGGAGGDNEVSSSQFNQNIAQIPNPSAVSGQPGPSTSNTNGLPPSNMDASRNSLSSADLNRQGFDLAKLGVTATGGTKAPAIQVASQLSSRGEGLIFVSGSLPSGVPLDQAVEVFAKHGDNAVSLGSLSSKNTPAGEFRGVVKGLLAPGTELYAKLASTNSFDAVSSRFRIDANTAGQEDLDRDGVPASLESMAANQDGNRDGVADSLQPNVFSIPDARYGNLFTLSSSLGVFENVRVVAPETAEERLLLSAGSFGFTVSDLPVGSITVVDMFFPDGFQGDTYWKRDATTGNLVAFDFDGTTGAVFFENRVRLFLQDGGRGDADGIANGSIVDPGGPGTSPLNLGSIPVTTWSFSETGGQNPGSATFNNVKRLTEGNSFQSQIAYAWTIPPTASGIRFQYELSFDRDAQFVNDAFEAAFVDSRGESLVPTIAGSRDSFFNATEGQQAKTGSTTIHTSSTVGNVTTGTVTLDLSEFPAGVHGNIILRLVNNDNQSGNDNSSYVQLFSLSSPPAGTDATRTINEDTAYTFAEADFGFTDPLDSPANTFTAVT